MNETTEEEEVTQEEHSEDREDISERLSEKQQVIEEMRIEIEEKNDEIDELESRLKRVHADFSNYKKRAKKKREKIKQRASSEILEDVIDVKDDLERALVSEGDIREGVELVVSKIDDLLSGEGVELIDTEGEADPELHEVLMTVGSDEHEDGEIVEVHRNGYLMNGEVLRTAQVVVAEGGEADGVDG